jgi:ATP-dependent Clp protease protease subunit
MQFKYVSKAVEKDTVTMLLYGAIGSDVNEINGDLFASELNWLANSGYYKRIKLRINCPGGDIFGGMSIYSAMRNSPIPVDVYIDYLAGSMGGVIALGGQSVHMASNGLIMVHNPWNPGGENDERRQNALKHLKESLVSIFTAKTGTEATFISDLMDRETWIGSKKAMEMKLVDSVFDPMVKVSPSKSQLADYAFVNRISKLIVNNMEGTALELATLQGELDKLKNSFKDQTTEVEKLKAENDALKKENEENKKEITEAKDKEATEYVDSLIAKGKAKKESRDSLLMSAKKDLSVVKSAYDSIPDSSVARFTNITTGEKAKPKNDGRESWTIRDYEKKDPKALLAIKKDDPETYKEMYDSYYKK